MGLFDKIKSIFTSEEQEKKSEEQDTPTEVSGSDDATDDSDLETIETIDQEKVEEPLSKEEVKSLEDEMAVTSDETVKQVDKPGVEDLHSSEESNTAETSDEPQRKTQTFSEVEASARAEAEQYKEGLKKSRRSFTRRLNELFSNFRYEDEEFFEELEDLLIESDVGFEATMYISEVMRYEAKVENIRSMKDAERVLVRTMVDLYGDTNPDYVEFNENSTGLTVLLFVGVNGVGKTTTIAKMAHQYIKAGKKVMLAAGDTFRAGAIEQLHVWGERVGAEVISSQQGGDPAAVVYDGLEQAKKNGADVLMIDTAGRLQNKKNLMNELEKMKRVVSREVPDAPHETLLVLDATTGQNALNQAKIFKDTTDVTGIVLTKMDGTAKGGIVLAIGKELGIPVKFVGLGETMEDLHKFDTEKFAYGLFRDLLEQTV
ncbi:signal recognition particle-docking protein FtsY [Dolosigranulum pigrum]|uniref:signal recognition particle-docking protein FtsY n=1 Tax=Dolosigranulum pigrum TaxID=29394 RepID=UPI001AD85FFA|nr:signal recognition particle-docking protein FtsY [Dolosigranulum pigrum]QTJ43144.1 signal recognition particle-docking protein FtsY [Dolosigranulum pigrum]QTJ46560.1 signal recognition particle-docking protein FtsY [Dolosigranulum pigrum]QTJ60083.1 signal recognition particle-docking protein FtsY [Dolosigranulum pigrum]